MAHNGNVAQFFFDTTQHMHTQHPHHKNSAKRNRQQSVEAVSMKLSLFLGVARGEKKLWGYSLPHCSYFMPSPLLRSFHLLGSYLGLSSKLGDGPKKIFAGGVYVVNMKYEGGTDQQS